jgi:flagellar protein FlaG
VNSAESVSTEQAIAAENEKKAQQQEDQSVEQTVEQINNYFQSMGRDLNFKVDDESGRTVITVLDSETQGSHQADPARRSPATSFEFAGFGWF